MMSCTRSPSGCTWLTHIQCDPGHFAWATHTCRQCSVEKLFCVGGRLQQQPAPELAQLRLGDGVHLASLQVGEGAAAALPQIRGPSVDVSFRLARGSCSAAGILLRAWLHADADSEQPTAAAAVVDWDVGTLEVRTPPHSLEKGPRSAISKHLCEACEPQSEYATQCFHPCRVDHGSSVR